MAGHEKAALALEFTQRLWKITALGMRRVLAATLILSISLPHEALAGGRVSRLFGGGAAEETQRISLNDALLRHDYLEIPPVVTFEDGPEDAPRLGRPILRPDSAPAAPVAIASIPGLARGVLGTPLSPGASPATSSGSPSGRETPSPSSSESDSPPAFKAPDTIVWSPEMEMIDLGKAATARRILGDEDGRARRNSEGEAGWDFALDLQGLETATRGAPGAPHDTEVMPLEDFLEENRQLTPLELERAKGFLAWTAHQAAEELPSKPWRELSTWEKTKRAAYWGTVGAFAVGWSWSMTQLASVPLGNWSPKFRYGLNGTLLYMVGVTANVLFLVPGAKQTIKGFNYLFGEKKQCSGATGWTAEDIRAARKGGWVWSTVEVAGGLALIAIPAANWFLFSATFVDYGLCLIPFLGPLFLEGCRKMREEIDGAFHKVFRREAARIAQERQRLKNRLKTAAEKLITLSDAQLERLDAQVFGAPPVVEVTDAEDGGEEMEDLEKYEDAVSARQLTALHDLYDLGTDEAPAPSKAAGYLKGLTWGVVGLGSMVWRGGVLESSIAALGNGWIATTGWGSTAAMGITAQVLAPVATLAVTAFAAHMLHRWTMGLWNRWAPQHYRASPFTPVSAPLTRGIAAGGATALSVYGALATIVLPDGPDPSNPLNFASFILFSTEAAAELFETVDEGYNDVIRPGQKRPTFTREFRIDRLRRWAEKLYDQVDLLPPETVRGIAALLKTTQTSKKI